MSTEATTTGGAGAEISPAEPSPPAFLRRLGEGGVHGLVWGLSLLVVALVVVLLAFPGAFAVEGADVSLLPGFHATINGLTALLLVLGYRRVRAGRVREHRAFMLAAFALSCLFLVSYVVYHSQAPPAHFGGEGWIRPVYFFILVTHVVLAPVILPLALYTILRGLRAQVGRHRRIARWTFPIWLYVAVTGVLIYLMMAPYYNP